MIQVVKRDGENAEFSLNKITEAIKKAFKATKKDYNNKSGYFVNIIRCQTIRVLFPSPYLSVHAVDNTTYHLCNPFHNPVSNKQSSP